MAWDQESIDSRDTTSTRGRNKGSYKKKALKSFLRHFGLCVLVSGYCVGGVYLFQYLENDKEIERLTEGKTAAEILQDMRKNIANNLSTSLHVLGTADYNNKVEEEFQAYYDVMKQSLGVPGFPPLENGTGYAIDESKNKWSFASALLFTVSVVTTVGYGHVSPVTETGQIMCVLYALVGIPLMIIFLAGIGDVMAGCFRFVYKRMCCYICFKKRIENYHENRTRVLQARGELPKSRNAWKETGDSRRRKGNNRDEDEVDDDYLRTIHPDSIQNPNDETVNVPITLTLVVIATYVFIGAIIFSAWESWSWTQGAYFSFVTLSTIGFGDLIPGWKGQMEGANATDGTFKLLASIVYIVFGLAVISMSFNLMVEEMLAKFRWLGQKLGIIDDERKKKLKQLQTEKRH